MSTAESIVELISKVNMWVNRLEETESDLEHCENPLNPSCESLEIELYILRGEKRIPLCKSCWKQISESNLEW